MLELLKWISKSYREIQVYLNGEFKEYGVNSTDYVFLKHLSMEGGINQETVAKHLSITKTAASKIVIKLIEKGLVKKEKGSRDKREYILYLTKKGMDLRELLMKKVALWENEVLGSYNKKDKEDYVNKVEETYKITKRINRSNNE
jgi:DNA-binding MarR family transcriptional regulator